MIPAVALIVVLEGVVETNESTWRRGGADLGVAESLCMRNDRWEVSDI
jgi:hypothetical protein